MPPIYDDSGSDTPLRNSTNNSNGVGVGGGVGGGGLNDDENAGDNSKVCGICDTEPYDSTSSPTGLCFDPITPFCQATLSSVDQITCGGVQSITGSGVSPHHADGPLEKLFKFRPSSYVVMSDYFTRGGSGGSDMQQQLNKDEREREDNGRLPPSTGESLFRMKERGGKAAALLKRTYPLSYNGEAPIGPTKCEYCAAESTMECTSNLPAEYNALFMGSTATAICKQITPTTTSSSSTPRPAIVCHRPKLFFLKKRPPFATMDGWNPVTEYRINLFEPPTTMEGMDRGWGEVRGHLGDKTSSNSNNTSSTTSAGGGGGDFGYGNYGNNNNNNMNMNATIDKERGRGGGSKSIIETASTVRAGNGNRISVVTNSTNNIHDDNSEGGGGENGGNGRTMSSTPVQWAWSGLMGILTPKSSKENLIK
jgi:hypothetical protein